ncbi:MAG: helix-turn-helix domain-containing protein [Methylococcales bacterium]
MKSSKSKIQETKANIFAELGLPDADGHFLKAQIVAELYRLSNARKFSQTEAGTLMGISQPEVSRLFKGHFREYSIERLMMFLTAFNLDVEIAVRPAKNARKPGKIRFEPEAA